MGTKKSVRAILLLVPHLEALELPIGVERANLQKPHAEYDISLSGTVVPSASFLTPIEFSRFPSIRKERRVNAVSLLCPQPSHIALDRASAGRSAMAKLAIIFDICNFLIQNNLNCCI